MLLSRQKPRLLFLYSELADYFLACIRKLISVYDVEVHIVHWPVNKEAPFVFDLPPQVRFYNRNQYDIKKLQELINVIKPDFVYCSGWMDKDYLATVRGLKNKIPVVIGLDTKWTGTFKQRIASAISKITLQKIFSHCWVPGQQQKKYALKLGFKENEIMTGYYSADVDHIKSIGQKALEKKKNGFPHKFIYVGRYFEFKGIKDLWNAFIEWDKENKNDWELWCLGVGNIEPVKHPKIKHFGFIQRSDISSFIQEAGVFIMPSHLEPWGVVLHEFASAGFPLICSGAVGSSEVFLSEGKNGYIYKAGHIEKLKECINKITLLSDSELIHMGEISMNMAMEITPDSWAKTVMKLIEHK